MQPLKPGYKTTEFWGMIAAQFAAALCVYFQVSPSDQQNLQDAVAQVIPAVAALIGSAYTVTHYIRSRTEVKSRHVDGQAYGNSPTPPSGGSALMRKAALALFGLVALAGVAEAQQPAYYPAVLPWRRQVEQRLQQQQQAPAPAPAPQMQDNSALLSSIQLLAQQIAQLQATVQGMQQKQQQAPAAPQFYYYAPPSPQQAPLQQIPLGGAPQQQIPLGPAPLQQIQIGGPPQQNIPIGQAPLQQIPLGGPPPQQLGSPPGTVKPPPAAAAPQTMPPASTGVPTGPPRGYLRYSVYRPVTR